ncbi:hypothetical protein [Cryobacterium sp. M15]|jgi:hypothetical protein|uniref:hypothetical protein n=1 Tax=Cryobacterium sp. M15 TaxID=2048291 RepID=UPI0011B0D9B9|nr:hypothetical protein [Cryobacterium sp. M15]
MHEESLGLKNFMKKSNTTLTSGRAGVAAALVIFALAGCAGATEDPAPVAGGPATSTSTPTPDSSPRPGESAISTDHVCGQVTALATLEANTVAGFEAGVLSADQYVAQMDMVAAGYEHVLVNDSDVGDRVADFVLFLKAAAPSAEGARFDRDADGWQNAVSEVALACNTAGSSVSVLAAFGG